MDASYLAGFIDGEGCLTILRIHRTEGNGRDYYRPVLSIGNTHLGVLEAIKEFVGAGWINSSADRRSTRKPCWAYWLTSGQKLLPLLEAIRPHLIVKAAQADELIAFIKTLQRKGRRKELPPHELRRRDAAVVRLRALNARGPALAAKGSP